MLIKSSYLPNTRTAFLAVLRQTIKNWKGGTPEKSVQAKSIQCEAFPMRFSLNVNTLHVAGLQIFLPIFPTIDFCSIKLRLSILTDLANWKWLANKATFIYLFFFLLSLLQRHQLATLHVNGWWYHFANMGFFIAVQILLLVRPFLVVSLGIIGDDRLTSNSFIVWLIHSFKQFFVIANFSKLLRVITSFYVSYILGSIFTLSVSVYGSTLINHFSWIFLHFQTYLTLI